MYIFMSGSLNDRMGAWRQCGLCPWRRTLHVYVLYTTYLVTTFGQCQTRFTEAPVIPLTSSKSAVPTAGFIQEVISNYTCRLSCKRPDLQQQSCKIGGNCNEISCRRALNCTFHCSGNYSIETVALSMTAVCDSEASQYRPPMPCDNITGQPFQFKKPDYLTWSEYLSKEEVDVSCYLESNSCFCCTTKKCCQVSLTWNCNLKPVAIPTSSSTTTTSKTTSTSKIATTTPTMTTNRTTTPPTTTTKKTLTTTTKKPLTTTTKTTPTTTTKTTPTTSMRRTTVVSTSEKGSNSPGVLTSTASTQTVTEGRSTASQTHSDYVPTIAVLASMLVLSIVVICIIIIIVLRRNSRRKQAENPEFIINNTAYGDVTQHPKAHPGPDTPKSSREVPAQPEAEGEHTYCYASFDDAKQTVNTESQQPNVQGLPTKTMASPENSYVVLETRSQRHGDNCKMEQAIAMDQSVEKDTGHLKNKLDKPSNYFVLEKPKSIYETTPPETGESANYFVLETTTDEHEPSVKRNQEKEITETGDTCSGKAGDNYFLVDKSDVGTTSDNSETYNVSLNHSTIENQDLTSNENYFVLDKITDDSKVEQQTETHYGNGLQTSDNTRTGAKPRANDTPTPTADPYDHVRIGHAHTNGFDDGVYDELRKQHARYEAEEVENDYDHC